jgi:hypothetical protein
MVRCILLPYKRRRIHRNLGGWYLQQRTISVNESADSISQWHLPRPSTKDKGQPKKPVGADNNIFNWSRFLFLAKQHQRPVMCITYCCVNWAVRRMRSSFHPPLIPPFHNAQLHKSSCSNSLQRNLPRCPRAARQQACRNEALCIPNIYTRPLGHEQTPANLSDARRCY